MVRLTTAVLLPGRICTGWPGTGAAAGSNADSAAPLSQLAGLDEQGPDQIGGRVRRVDRHEDRVRHQVPALPVRVQVVQVAGLVVQLEQVLREQAARWHGPGFDGPSPRQRGDPPLPVHPLQGELLVQQCPAALRRHAAPAALTLPSSFAVISTTAVFCDPKGCLLGRTVGDCAITVTAGPGPGCHDRLADLVKVFAGDRVVITEIGAGQQEVLDYQRRAHAGGRAAHDPPAAVRALLLAAGARRPCRVLEQPAGRHVGTPGRQGHTSQPGREPAKQPPALPPTAPVLPGPSGSVPVPLGPSGPAGLRRTRHGFSRRRPAPGPPGPGSSGAAAAHG